MCRLCGRRIALWTLKRRFVAGAIFCETRSADFVVVAANVLSHVQSHVCALIFVL